MGKEYLLNVIVTLIRIVPSTLIDGFLESIIETVEGYVIESENTIDDFLFTKIMNLFASHKAEVKKAEDENGEC